MTIAPSKPYCFPFPPHCTTPLSTTLHYPKIKLKQLKEMTNVFVFGKISPNFDLKYNFDHGNNGSIYHVWKKKKFKFSYFYHKF